MAGDKSEEPTAKHLRDARDEGQVVKSQEVPATAVVLAMFLYVWFGFDYMVAEVVKLYGEAIAGMGYSFEVAFAKLVPQAGWSFLKMAFPAVLLAALAGVLGHVGQVGILFAWKAAMPKLDKLNPKQWFGKVFSLKNLIEFLRSILKIAVIVFVFYQVFVDALPLLMRVPGHGAGALRAALGVVMQNVATYCLAAFAAIAALDWFFQRYQFMKEHRMSKEDVKNEYKEQEGDPQIKGKRKQMHQEMANDNSTQAVRRADVLVTNPTHLAIAIEYKQDKTPLPLILAKGQGHLAERMIKVAEECGVPIMRNVPLAHDLWEQGEELHYIPSSLIEPVAEVLRWLRDLRASEGKPT